MLRFAGRSLGLGSGRSQLASLSPLSSSLQPRRQLHGLKVGVVAETLPFETRVAVTPANVTTLKKAGAHVSVQTGAGVASGFADADYTAAGATVVDAADAAWQQDVVSVLDEFSLTSASKCAVAARQQV
jgi:hypothetical protein